MLSDGLGRAVRDAGRLLCLSMVLFWPLPLLAEQTDFAQYDQAVLVVLCERMEKRIAELEAEVDQLKAQLAGGTVDLASKPGSGVVQRGQWVVTIQSVSKEDTAGVEREIATEQAKRPQLEQTLRAAQNDVDRARSAIRHDGNARQVDRRIQSAEQAVSAAERRIKQTEARIKRLERQKRALQGKRSVMATLEDGKSVSLSTPTKLAAVVDSWGAGDRIQVTGTLSLNNGSGRISVSSAGDEMP